MRDVNFYQVLGIAPSAGAEDIRSAYRELVKKHHPDLFSDAREKSAATEKLRQINEAYAVLGNPERRERYDKEFLQPAQSRPRSPVAGERRTAPSRRRRAGLSQTSAAILKRLKDCRFFSKERAGYALAAATAMAALVYANQSEPRLAAAWLLVEKLDISPRDDRSKAGRAVDRWVPVGEYATVSQCAAMLKKIVVADEQEGSRVIYDERGGTMAITVYLRSETSRPQSGSGSTKTPESSGAIDPQSKVQQSERGVAASPPKNSAFKRVRNLECREVRKVESESRARRLMKNLGFFGGTR
jgi:curved DNA-binding protein CbpA